MANWFRVFILMIYAGPAFPQKDLPEQITFFKRIVTLVRENKVAELASLVDYPIVRQNPLPNIESEHQFISYYPVLFDSVFKVKLLEFDTSAVFEHHGMYGVFPGDLWWDPRGKIITINYSSQAEQRLLSQMNEETRMKLYPELREFEGNKFEWDAEQYRIRVDRTKNGLRYASWKKDKPTSDRPDLILYNGEQGFYGTQGGWYIKFVSGEWTYVTESIEICAGPGPEGGCGTFLRVMKGDSLIAKFNCKAVK